MLRTLSIQTFTETFAEHNTAEDMQKYVEENLNPEKLLHEFNTPGSDFYFLMANDAIAGYMKLNSGLSQTVSGKDHTLEIERIYILKAFYGKHLGNQLLQHAIAVAKQQHYPIIWLGVWERNTKAIAFYERHGFIKTGSHAFVLGEDEQTDYIMELHIV